MVSESKAGLLAANARLLREVQDLSRLVVALNDELMVLRDTPAGEAWGATTVDVPAWFLRWYA